MAITIAYKPWYMAGFWGLAIIPIMEISQALSTYQLRSIWSLNQPEVTLRGNAVIEPQVIEKVSAISLDDVVEQKMVGSVSAARRQYARPLRNLDLR